MTKKEKLQKLKEMRNPMVKASRLLEEQIVAIEKIELQKGEDGRDGVDGYTPVKGKDYYTEAEINFIIQYIQSRVKDGEPGPAGTDGIDGRNGITPVRGVDYWTPKDQEKILQSVLGKIPKPKDGITPNTEEIVNSVVDQLKKKPIEFKDIKGTEELVRFLRSGGFRGGGLSNELCTNY